ncbi:(Fe-S)-binding protein [Microlunatus flavus]|uniref:Glycolate oxidase iron-sulfur subunit n=1 Tax=Microlunatus flavus TaxID=1036181 RepID=A0A1H9L4K9_9ACTN|nr:(Fe-S)-binding protein [Microlunatus flavus]SER06189.1 glycolate oxidase iron-sulfur subunit [Microlunatus flavus]
MTPALPEPVEGPEPEGRGIFPAELLDRCISCGFCLPACPTYALTKEEKSSPRGRIGLMRMLETGELDEDDPTLQHEASFCLGCRACEPVCPAGVQYGQLLEHWRDHQWRGVHVPPVAAALREAVEHPKLIETAGRLVPHGRTEASPVGAAEDRTERASLMLGCFERGLFPRVSRAALALRPELECPSDQGCCGALHAHNGDSATGVALAEALGERLPGTIVTTAGGCAGHLAHVLGDRVQELSVYLAAHPRDEPLGEVLVDGRRARVGLQDSCHLRNGLGVWEEPRALVAEVADYVEVPGAASCCGSAGSYSLLRPRDSRRVLAPKLDAIEALDLDLLVTVNPGCQRQLVTGLRRRRSRTRVLSLAELLVLARGGPPPRRRSWRLRRGGANDEPGELAAHLNDRPAPDDPGAAGAGPA